MYQGEPLLLPSPSRPSPELTLYLHSHQGSISEPIAAKTLSVESLLAPVRPQLGATHNGNNLFYPPSRGVDLPASRPPLLPNFDMGFGPFFSTEKNIQDSGNARDNIAYIQEHFHELLMMPHDPLTIEEAVNRALMCSKMSSFIQITPYLRGISQSVPPTAYPTPLPTDEYLLLFHFVTQQLCSLDDKYVTQREAFHRIRWLCVTRGPFLVIPILVVCVLEKGVEKGVVGGFLYNEAIATFIGYFLQKASKDLERHGGSAKTLLDLIQWTFTFTFYQCWTAVRLAGFAFHALTYFGQPPTVDSNSYKFMLGVTSFYGYLYSKKTLDEETFLACLKILSRLTPLDVPIEALQSLIESADGSIPGISRR